MNGIYEMVAAQRQRMFKERIYLHEHPELSGEETRTCAYLTKELEALGMDVFHIEAGGVIGVLNGKSSGPAIILRADVDALPIQESEMNLKGPRTCISQAAGRMHACGHDAHMAMLLCAARILSGCTLDVPVLFVFEQGEENNSGFRNLLPFLDEHFHIGACYATHVRWDIPSGQIAICPGTAMAGGFGFRIELKGRSGHGARPDLASSPIDCFAALHGRLNALRMTAVEPDQVLTYSVGTVNAGQAINVIPETLTFSGTVRTYDSLHAGERFADAMRETLRHTAEAYGCDVNILHFPKLLHETSNDPHLRSRLIDAIQKQLPEVTLTDVRPWMASETMSAYLKWWPGVLSFTGIQNPQKGSGAPHHTPQFDIDEDAMLSGASVAVLAALEWNRSPETVPHGFRTEPLESILERRL